MVVISEQETRIIAVEKVISVRIRWEVLFTADHIISVLFIPNIGNIIAKNRVSSMVEDMKKKLFKLEK